MLIDTHCHLDFDVFSDDRAAIIAQAEAIGIKYLVIPGVTVNNWQPIQALCRQYPLQLLPALGLHPCFWQQHQEQHLSLLEQALTANNPVAVGEIGLDFFIENPNENWQLQLFREQVRLAKQHKLPIIVHCRKAHDQCFKILRELAFQEGGFMHAFSGSLQQAKRFVELGFKLGIGGAATYERAHKLHRILKTLPLDSFVLETDAPDIPPCFARNEVNTPLNLPKIAQVICERTAIDESELMAVTSAAALTVLAIPEQVR